jgi:hypothetical protein
MNKEAITAINCIMNIKISRFVFKLDTFPKPKPLIKYPTLMHREVENPRVSVGNSSKVVAVKMLLTIYKAARVEIVTTYLVYVFSGPKAIRKNRNKDIMLNRDKSEVRRVSDLNRTFENKEARNSVEPRIRTSK